MQSVVKDNEYYTSYTIAPMLELLWAEDMTGEVTRYKVLFSITTPMAHMQPQLIDSECSCICVLIVEKKKWNLSLHPTP